MLVVSLREPRAERASELVEGWILLRTEVHCCGPSDAVIMCLAPPVWRPRLDTHRTVSGVASGSVQTMRSGSARAVRRLHEDVAQWRRRRQRHRPTRGVAVLLRTDTPPTCTPGRPGSTPPSPSTKSTKWVYSTETLKSSGRPTSSSGHASTSRCAPSRAGCPHLGEWIWDARATGHDQVGCFFFGGSAAAMLVERRGWRARLSTRAVQHQEVPDKHTARPTSVPLHSQLLRRHQDTRSQRFFHSVFELVISNYFSKHIWFSSHRNFIWFIIFHPQLIKKLWWNKLRFYVFKKFTLLNKWPSWKFNFLSKMRKWRIYLFFHLTLNYFIYAHWVFPLASSYN